MTPLVIDIDILPGRRARIVPAYITIHETGNTAVGADADAHARYLRGADAAKRKVSWHYTVDRVKIVKHLNNSTRGSHTGTAKGNTSSIGIEMCVDGGELEQATLELTARLTALLCAAYSIPMTRVVTHEFWSGKNCPRKLLSERGGWESFLALTRKFYLAAY